MIITNPVKSQPVKVLSLLEIKKPITSLLSNPKRRSKMQKGEKFKGKP